MALLQTYGAGNRVIINDKSVTYSQARVTGTWESEEDAFGNKTTYSWMWQFHRYCQKSYKYVGMDLPTANACAAAMISKYSRTFYVSTWNPAMATKGNFEVVIGGIMPMADVAVQQVNGCMYEVIINVREDDSRLTKAAPETDIASLFANENERDYDTGEEVITNG